MFACSHKQQESPGRPFPGLSLFLCWLLSNLLHPATCICNKLLQMLRWRVQNQKMFALQSPPSCWKESTAKSLYHTTFYNQRIKFTVYAYPYLLVDLYNQEHCNGSDPFQWKTCARAFCTKFLFLLGKLSVGSQFFSGKPMVFPARSACQKHLWSTYGRTPKYPQSKGV